MIQISNEAHKPSSRAMQAFHHGLDLSRVLSHAIRHVRNDEIAPAPLSRWQACRILIGAQAELLSELHQVLLEEGI